MARNRSNLLLWIGELVKDCVLPGFLAGKKMKNSMRAGKGNQRGLIA
jgi:hypothetical protein